MSEIIGWDALDRYRDLFDKTEHELMRETMLDAEMRSTCSHCGETQLGPAREVKEWFKSHALQAHGITVKGGSRKTLARINTPLTLEQKAQALAARVDNLAFPSHMDKYAEGRARGAANAQVKWTRERMIKARDEFVGEYGFRPSSKRWKGRPHWSCVKREFGTWADYMEAK